MIRQEINLSKGFKVWDTMKYGFAEYSIDCNFRQYVPVNFT